MTTPDLPQQLHISRGSTSDGTTASTAADPSPSGTTFYSLDEQEANLKRQDRPDDDGLEPTVAIKQQKTFHDNDNDRTMPTTPTTPNPASKPVSPSASSVNDFTVVENTPFELVEPDWSANNKAWAFLQSQNPKYPNKYLIKKESDGNDRVGYLLGRSLTSDIK